MGNNFIFYSSFFEALEGLPDDSYIRLSKCIISFGVNGVETELQGFEKNIFATIRPQILANVKKREDGKKGGRPRDEPCGEKSETTAEEEKPLVNEEEKPLVNEEEKPLVNEEKNQWLSEAETSGGVNEKPNVNVKVNVKENVNAKEKEFTPDFSQDAINQPSFPSADADEQAIIPVSQSPPSRKPRKQELTQEQLVLFHAAKACFESSERSKALIYQDKETTAREMKHLKTLVTRCTNIAPDITDGFLQNVLEHFKTMCNGKLAGKAVFTPRSLITPWIWELVINSLPENESPELREIIKGLFK